MDLWNKICVGLKIVYIGYIQPVLEKIAYKTESTEYTDLVYYQNGNQYKIRFQKVFSLPMNIKIRSDSSDVTTDILPYIGPHYDFHSQKYTPKSLGYPYLEFSIDGEGVYYDKDSVIGLPLD